MNLAEFVNERESRSISPTAMSTSALIHLYKERDCDQYLVKVLQTKHNMGLEIDICREGTYLHEDYPTKTLIMEYSDESPKVFTHEHELNTFATHYNVSIYGRDLETMERTHIKTYDMMRMTEDKRKRTIFEVLPEDSDTEISHTNNELKWIPSEREVKLLFGEKSVSDMLYDTFFRPKCTSTSFKNNSNISEDITNALYVPYMPYIVILSIVSIIMMSLITYIISSFF